MQVALNEQDVRFLRSIRVSLQGFVLPAIDATGGPIPHREITTTDILRRLQTFRDESEGRRPWAEE